MKIVLAKDYGIVPGSGKCQAAAVKAMLRENKRDTYFRFEPGVYHFYARNAEEISAPVSNSDWTDKLKTGILLENTEGITLDGEGACFLFHGNMTPFTVSDCRGLGLQNLTIDFAEPFAAEARILNSSADAVEIYLDKILFPYEIRDEQLYFQDGYGGSSPMFGALEFDVCSNRVRAGAGDTFPAVKAYGTGKNTVRLEGNFTVLPQPGNVLVLRFGKRVHPGALIQYSEDVCLENVTVHQTAGLGMVFQFNENITVKSVKFQANYERGHRFISSHDDGLHFSNNRGKILVEDCRFFGLMDDPINVHGTAAVIKRKTESGSLICEYRHPQSKGFPRWARRGDVAAVLDPEDRSCRGYAPVSSYRLLSRTEFELVLDGEMPERDVCGYAVENISNTPEVICRNNYFGSCRARGILVTTPRPVLIENNTFESSGSAVLFAGDINEWYESGNCRNVKIRLNRFIGCCTSEYQFCSGVLHIEPGVKAGRKAAVHKNILIENNVFLQADEPVLYADHAADVVIRENDIWREKSPDRPEFILEDCENTSFSGNRVNGKPLHI